MSPTVPAVYDLPTASLECVFHCLKTKKAPIGERVIFVQKLWTDLYHLGADAPADATLPQPGHMLAALQVNIRGGRRPEADGDSYLRIPVGKLDPR